MDSWKGSGLLEADGNEGHLPHLNASYDPSCKMI